MRFYVASGLENFAAVREVSAELKALGHQQTYDWTEHCDVRDQGGERMRQVAGREVSAVLEADLVIALLPGGRGTHTEIGLAVARAALTDKGQVWLWSQDGSHFMPDERTCTFYFHPRIRRFCGDIKQVLEAVKENWGEIVP